MVNFLHQVKDTGDIPPDHYSHDHLNEQKQVHLDGKLAKQYKSEFTRIQEECKSRGEKVKWGLVDGFLLYWNPKVVELLDVCIFLRVPEETLKQRRHERHGYHTAGKCGMDERHRSFELVLT